MIKKSENDILKNKLQLELLESDLFSKKYNKTASCSTISK